MEKILEGEIAAFQIPDLLTFLNMGRRTCVLVLERQQQETKLFLREGNPVFATSTLEQLRLGSMLVRFGKTSAEALERMLAKRPPGGQRIGQVLLAERVLTEEELASLLKVQVSEVIFDTFVWREGLFTVFDGIEPPATAVTLEMDLQNLIMEGVRRLDERGRIQEVFPDLDMVVESVMNPDRVKQSLTLTEEEWRVFFLVDGRRSLSEICRLAGNPDELVTLLTLYHLLAAKFISLRPPAPAAPPRRPPLPAGAEGTQHFIDVSPQAGDSISVEFSAPVLSRRLEDDTREVVGPKAIPYLDNARRLTVSRLILYVANKESSFPLTRDAYTLGRHKNNDIVINDPKVSSFHARIDRTAEGFVMVDLKSRNGSFINGKKVGRGALESGDEVRLGTAKLVYKVDYISTN